MWGKTRPEMSSKYRETVCTGGIFEDTRSLVRLYPIPLRYLDSERIFSKYQWIEADVQRAAGDPRPESYRINADNIVVQGKIPPDGNWAARAPWILTPQNQFTSVEALQAKQQRDHTSLGLVKPQQIVQIANTPVPPDEKNAFWNRYHQTVAQLQFEFKEQEPVKPITPPDFRFQIRFTCNDSACTTVHKFSVLDWEIDALYSKMRYQKKHPPTEAARKCIESLEDVCGRARDTQFFLGNISNHPQIFTIVGFWYPKKQAPGLFDTIDHD